MIILQILIILFFGELEWHIKWVFETDVFRTGEIFSKLTFISYQNVIRDMQCNADMKENTNDEPRLLSFAAFKRQRKTSKTEILLQCYIIFSCLTNTCVS